MSRKEKLRIFQILFLITGVAIIFFTFLQSNKFQKEQIISDNLQKKIDKEISSQGSDKNSTFYNVKYSGLDLEGNRYTISSKKAVNSDTNENVVNMSGVSAVFYFKDNTELNILSNKAIYNNKTLDIKFEDSVKCLYENSELYAGSAEFLNSKNSLTVSNNVKIIDSKGTIFADKLTFDIKNKTLNITSLNENTIKSKINYK
tara:strand:+ start:1040 stop:1645 length:606 start_codon:yes stop_codon:yes gene_type:complete